MAQVITTTKANGVFEAAQINYYTLTSDSFSADLTDEKDGITAIIEIPSSASGEFELVCLSAKGDELSTIPLVGKAANYIRLTTHGIKKNDGFGDFKIVSPSGAIVPAAGIKLGFIKYTPVVNH